MATGTRLRFDFIGSALGAPISDSDTELIASAFTDMPGIAHAVDGGFAVAIIDRKEIVHVVSHAVGSSTVVVERGQEGTDAVAHDLGVPVLHGSTAADFDAVIDDAIVMAIALGE